MQSKTSFQGRVVECFSVNVSCFSKGRLLVMPTQSRVFSGTKSRSPTSCSTDRLCRWIWTKFVEEPETWTGQVTLTADSEL